MASSEYDVIVVGGGNAAFCAALAAQEQGAKVVMLEVAPEDESGGNSRFTAGSVRVVYNGIDDIKALVPDLTPQEIAETDFGTYTAEKFFDDMALVTQNRPTPTWSSCWSPRASTPFAGCATRACASSRSTAGRPSRSTASSSSGAASRSRRSAAVLA
jgi:predicted oxidoreductase